MGRQLSLIMSIQGHGKTIRSYGLWGVLIKPMGPFKGHMAQLAIAPMVKIPYLVLGLTDDPFWVIEQMINCQMQVLLVPTPKAKARSILRVHLVLSARRP